MRASQLDTRTSTMERVQVTPGGDDTILRCVKVVTVIMKSLLLWLDITESLHAGFHSLRDVIRRAVPGGRTRTEIASDTGCQKKKKKWPFFCFSFTSTWFLFASPWLHLKSSLCFCWSMSRNRNLSYKVKEGMSFCSKRSISVGLDDYQAYICVHWTRRGTNCQHWSFCFSFGARVNKLKQPRSILQTTGIYKLLSLFWLNLNISLGWLQWIQISCVQDGEAGSWSMSESSFGLSPPSQSGCYNTLFGRLKRGVAWNTPQTSSKHTIDQKFSVVISSWGWWSSFYNRVSFIVLTKPLDIQDPLNTFKCLPFISLMTLKVVKVVWAGSRVFSCQYHHMIMFILQFYVVTMQCWCLFRSGHWKRSCLGFPVLLPVAEKGLNCGLLISRTT